MFFRDIKNKMHNILPLTNDQFVLEIYHCQSSIDASFFSTVRFRLITDQFVNKYQSWKHIKHELNNLIHIKSNKIQKDNQLQKVQNKVHHNLTQSNSKLIKRKKKTTMREIGI